MLTTAADNGTSGASRQYRRVFLHLATAAIAVAALALGCSTDLGQIAGGTTDGGGAVKKACKNNAQCGKDETCKNNLCESAGGGGGDGGEPCKTKIDCNGEEECIGGRCVPADGDGGGGGGGDNGPRDGSLPNGDADGCQGANACGSGYRCNAETQKCEPAAIVKVDPGILDFGAVPYNSEVQLQLTVSNTGKADLRLLGIEFEQGTNPDPGNPIFKKTVASQLPATLKENEYLTVTISYHQDDARPDSGAILVTSTDLEHSLTRVPMKSGYKGSPDLAVVDRTQSPPTVLYPVSSSTDDYTVDVGNVALGGARQQIVTFMNATQGNAILSFDQLKTHQKTANEFVVTFHDALTPATELTPPIFLSQGDMIDLYVDYSPTVKTADEQTDLDLYVNDTDVNNDGTGSDNILYIRLKGKAGWLPPGISVSKAQVSFGEVQRNTVAQDTVRVCNDGGDTLTLAGTSGLTLPQSDFSVSPVPLARVLNPTDCFDITVYFGPKSIGQASNGIILDSNDTNNPHIVIPLTGTGSDPTITVFPQSVDFGSGFIGKPAAPQQVSMKNTGIGMLRVTKIDLTPGSSADFTLTQKPTLPASVRDNQQDTISFMVNFTPRAKGKISGAVQIDNSDTKNPVVIVNVTGDGSDCPSGTLDCDGDPLNGCETNSNTDKNHCGGCNKPCAVANGTGKCVAGDCKVDACTLGFADCNGIYADGCEVGTTGDPNNCSACNSKCTYTNAVGTCANSQCQFDHCNAGFGDCNANTADGCEINLNTDVTHCGACTGATTTCAVTNGVPKCDAGVCKVDHCSTNYADCDGAYDNGCEVNLMTDVAHCNSCATPCGAFPNGTPKCDVGVCKKSACNAGFDDCDSAYDNGCEINLKTDKDHCGTCIKKCTVANGAGKCDNGSCAIASCTAPWADCVNGLADGCETNTLSDVNNCGGCAGAGGQNCNGSCNAGTQCVPGCNTGVCQIALCLSDYKDCDGLFSNGCEANSASDPNNCGACNAKCLVANGTGQCVNKVCGIASCTAPYKDCINGYADGCETNSGSDINNCGNCGTICTVNHGTPSCNGSCGIASCTDPWKDCSGGYANGCETDTSSNASHCGACNAACTPANATGACVSKACQISACNATYNDLNGTYSDGCECRHDAYDQAARGGSCGNTEPGTIIIAGGLSDDSSASTSVTGNIASVGDVDWYRVQATDSRAQDVAAGGDTKFKFAAKWLANPNNEFQFDVQVGNCATAMCSAVDNASPGGDGTNMSHYFNFRATSGCPGGTNPCGENPCYDSGDNPGKNLCADNSQTYYIKVYRNPAKPITCSNYQLEFSNGKY